jgi:gamma-glutamyltranspeptidase / glutathione hydrolase
MMGLEFKSRRSVVFSKHGMVAASQPLAVAAGLEMLKQGGNAADAAVAAAAALAVTEPSSTGLGGDCFALYFDAQTHKVSALNGSGRAPAALNIERVKAAGFEDEIPIRHPYTITVPGSCAGWCDMVKKHGRLPISAVLAPAIRLAEQGFPVAPLTAQSWDGSVQETLSKSPGGEQLMISGRAPRAGEVFRNPGMSWVLQTIAEGGKQAFYQGEPAVRIANAVQAAGGCLALSDLASHLSTWEDPIATTYRGIRIWECPPNGQGLTALIALNILEGYDLSQMDPLSAGRLHLEIEALRLAFADTRWYVSDPLTNPAPLERLLSKEYAADRRKLINPQKTNLDYQHSGPTTSSDTVYLCTADEQGNACSFINSNYLDFGCGVVPPGCGFALQNRGNSFRLDPEHPNALAPKKRPYHTIIPAMATYPADTTGGAGFEHEQLYAAFGVMGGFMQPQGHMQVVTGLLDDGLSPQEALDRPRFCLLEGIPSGEVALEEGIPVAEMAGLAEMGHHVTPVSGVSRSVFGRGQIIRRDPETGVLCGGSDPRADGCVMTLV